MVFLLLKMKRKEYDFHIVDALKKLPIPLKSFDGHDVLFDKNKRYETIYEYIANKKHRLKVKDIELLPEIFSKKSSLRKDKIGTKFRCYIFKNKAKKERLKFIKIITRINTNKTETIITIHKVKNY